MNYKDRIPTQTYHQQPWVNPYVDVKQEQYDKNGRKIKPKNFGVVVILLLTLGILAAERLYLGHYRYAICKVAIIVATFAAFFMVGDPDRLFPAILIFFVGGCWILRDFVRVLKRKINNVNWDDRP